MKPAVLGFAVFVAMTGSATPAKAQPAPSPARIFSPEPVKILTQRYDNARTGANLSEHILDVSSVSSGEFQKLYSYPVDGQIYAQPLFVPTVAFPDGIKNVLIVATMKNQVYAFQVDDAIYGPAFSPVLLWSVNVGQPVRGNFLTMASSGYRCVGRLMCVPLNPKPSSSPWALPPVGMSPRDVVTAGYGSYNINPFIGIVSTPVVDPQLGRVFLVSKQMAAATHPTRANNCSADARDGASPVNRLISLNLRTGEELGCVDLGLDKAGWKTGIASDRDHRTKQIQLDNRHQMQRPALLLQNGEIYAGLASHQDTFPWHGWIFAYDEDLKFKASWISTPNGMGGGIWQSGSGLAGDSRGRIYAMIGNGERDSFDGIGPKWFDLSTQPEWPFHNYAGMFVQLSPDLHVVGHYDTGPADELYRELLDEDVGASGPVLMPDTPFVLGGDKEAKFFVLDTDHRLARRQYFQAGAQGPIPPAENHHIHAAPAVWRSKKLGLMAYVWPERDNLRGYRWNGNQFDTQPAQISKMTATNCLPCMPGGMVTVSADGDKDGSGIVWGATTEPGLTNTLYSFPAAPGVTNIAPGVLYAFDAESLSQPIWSSDDDAQRDGIGLFAKFNLPVVAEGRVYVPTFSDELYVFGLREWAKVISVSAPPNAPVATASPFEVTVTLLNAGTTVWTAGSYYLAQTGSSTPTEAPTYQLPANVFPGSEVTVRIPVTAPRPGNYSLQWQMVNRDSHWFGEATPATQFTAQ